MCEMIEADTQTGWLTIMNRWLRRAFETLAPRELPRDKTGTCETCSRSFSYQLVHNGFNDSAHAYCDRCGMTALFSAWSSRSPKDINVGLHGPITRDAEARVDPCECGGKFRGTAGPRCPYCGEPLSAEKAAVYIEGDAPGTRKGWRWQQTWLGLYAMILEHRVVNDPWQSGAG